MRCWRPYPAYRMNEIRNWLNEQAEKGRKLVKWGSAFVYLEEDPDGNRYQYCLDADRGKREAEEERKKENAERGWEYVCSTELEYIHIYRALKECGGLPEEPGRFSHAAKRHGGYGILLAALLIFYLIAAYALFWSDGCWLLTVMQTGVKRFLFPFPFLLFLLAAQTAFMINEFRLASRLRNGRLPDDTRNRKRKIPDGLVNLVGSFLILLLGLWNLFGTKDRYQTISEVYPPLPIVDLSVLEGDDFQIDRFELPDEPGLNYNNRIKIEPVLFAGSHYETIQMGTKKGTPGPVISLSGEYWEVEAGRLSDKLFSQLVSRYTEFQWNSSRTRYKKQKEAEWSIDVKDAPGFRSLKMAKGIEGSGREDITLVFAQTENYVIYLNYSGDAGDDRIIEMLEKSFGGL